MMVKVKICGVTIARDAMWAARVGADAIGFNFVPNSPRYILPEWARAIAMQLPPFVARVGVFVDSGPEEVAETAAFCGLDYVQLHGHETPRQCGKLNGHRVIKAFHIRSEDDLRVLGRYRVEAYLLDTYVRGVRGGTGRTFNWSVARAARTYGPIILAGGLNPENVADAVAKARPYAVDVASGVEEEPGGKSDELVKAFVRNAKSVDL